MERGDSIIAAIMVGAATCVAMSQATDLMLDLKTGYLVGATPRMQQIGQFAGAWLGPIVVILRYFRAERMRTASAAKSCRHRRRRHWRARSTASWAVTYRRRSTRRERSSAASCRRSWAGSALRLVSASTCRSISCLTYSLGTLAVNYQIAFKGKTWSEEVGIPIAAGLIVGEALVGVGNALAIVWTA